MIKKRVTMIAAILMVILSSACTPMVISDSNLYWGQYSETLYHLKKNPNADTRANHINQLNAIIEKSNELHLRVPPGIYAELGLYTIEDGDSTKANEYFQLEQRTYPESIAMINQIIKNK